MKVLTLNTWGGRAGIDSLLRFFDARREVDVFCLQEVWNGGEHMRTRRAAGQPLTDVHTDLMTRILEVLPKYRAFFHPHFEDHFGLLTLVHERYAVEASGDVFVHKERGYVHARDVGNHARNLQYTTISLDDVRCTVLNIHGLWNGGGKRDCPERLIQSERIVASTKTLAHPFILAGDLNLEPDTESMAILEQSGMRNLVKEYGITSTRTPLYTKQCPFADYILTSAGVTVDACSVLPDVVSDHAPVQCVVHVA